MEAALPRDSGLRPGTRRILAHCAGFARITGEERASARARLENVLGDDMAHRVVGALIADGREQSGRLLS